MGRHISDTCEVICEDNGRKIVAELLHFVERKSLSVSIDRSVRLNLRWNGKLYEGNSRGISFISNGPDIIETRNGRRSTTT